MDTWHLPRPRCWWQRASRSWPSQRWACARRRGAEDAGPGDSTTTTSTPTSVLVTGDDASTTTSSIVILPDWYPKQTSRYSDREPVVTVTTLAADDVDDDHRAVVRLERPPATPVATTDVLGAREVAELLERHGLDARQVAGPELRRRPQHRDAHRPAGRRGSGRPRRRGRAGSGVADPGTGRHRGVGPGRREGRRRWCRCCTRCWRRTGPPSVRVVEADALRSDWGDLLGGARPVGAGREPALQRRGADHHVGARATHPRCSVWS